MIKSNNLMKRSILWQLHYKIRKLNKNTSQSKRSTGQMTKNLLIKRLKHLIKRSSRERKIIRKKNMKPKRSRMIWL